MATLILMAVMVSAYAGIFLVSIWLCATAERDAFPVAQAVPPRVPVRPVTQRPISVMPGVTRASGITDYINHDAAAA